MPLTPEQIEMLARIGYIPATPESHSEAWKALCNAIIAAASKSQGASLQYAASYAKAGLEMTGETRIVQASYILCNLGGWRGDEAKAVKADMKRFAVGYYDSKC